MLDVGCGVGGPAREICKFTGANIVGLNNNDYQIERATHYAAKEGMSEKVAFVKGDFMVGSNRELVKESGLICALANGFRRQHL